MRDSVRFTHPVFSKAVLLFGKHSGSAVAVWVVTENKASNVATFVLYLAFLSVQKYFVILKQGN